MEYGIVCECDADIVMSSNEYEKKTIKMCESFIACIGYTIFLSSLIQQTLSEESE